ncbi:MAG: GNAT family N-acetyltransferase [Alphaproteobacteria bacterium]|nr:GNAT family N-acetyltransferase [Alphaproteobacteria bacterium]
MKMTPVIKDFKITDLPALRVLNNSAVPHVPAITEQELQDLAQKSCYLRTAWIADRLAGFLLALGPGQDYQSLNYKWFSERYKDFVYIDRVVVAEEARGTGIGKALYEDIESFSRERTGLITCEVNLFPPNPQSVAFHKKAGFCEVGQQNTESGSKRVSLLIKPLDAETASAVCRKAG